MSAGRPGGWPPHQMQPQQTGSQQASPASSATPNYGEYANANAMYPNMQAHNPVAAAARYNASVLSSPASGTYGQPQLSPSIQQQQQFANAPPGQNPYYAAAQFAGQQPGQHMQAQQQRPPTHPSPPQVVRPRSRGGVPPSQPMFGGQPVNTAYNSFNNVPGQNAEHTINDPNAQYGGSWISTVPSTYTPQDGSALSKSSQYQIRDGVQQAPGMYQMQSMMGQMNGGVSMPAQMQHQQYGMMMPGQAGKVAKTEDGDEDGDDADDGDGETGGRKRNQRGGASEFVKKLFRMLDDTSYAHIVSWGPLGDSFVVRDMNDFTKHVLPRHFRHSNFASFVRQLNKYDFHKVRKPETEGQPQPVGVEQQWEFKHPAFQRGREDLLENVRRKVPTGKKVGRKDDDSPRDGSPNMPGMADAADRGAQEYTQLKDQVANLTASQDQMTSHINNLTKQYQAVIGEMLTFQKNMVQQDQLMQNLIQYLMNLEADRKIDGPSSAGAPPIAGQPQRQLENSNGAFISSADAERLVSSFSDVAKESFSQMSMLSQRAAMNGNGTPTTTHNISPATNMTSLPRHSVEEGLSPRSSSQPTPVNMTGQSPMTDKGKERAPSADRSGQHSIFVHPPHFEADQPSNELLNAAASAVDNPSLAGFEGAGLRVFTVGTLQPRSDSADATDPGALASALSKNPPSAKGADESNRPYGINVPNLEQLPAKMPRVDGRTTSGNPTPSGEDSDTGTPRDGNSNLLRVRRSTYVPGWAVPPKVLVVDDDDVCRKLGSKFLQVFGCAIDVAVDGVTAVNKMNLEKYDLVLMDIVMPNLDGVSATSLIREFDARTPIISMTSNSGPQELLSYMSSGMTDVLPKPFTKEGLLNMLEKHLIHLKTVQKMDEIPKALGLPPLSEDVMQSVLSATAASAHSMGASSALGTEGANPMAAMMGYGPEMLRASQDAANGGFAGLGEEDSLVNPLAGMGFSDEEYISMLQNLIAAGAVSDSARGENADSVANVMGVARGEGVGAMSAGNGTKSKEGTPQSTRGSMPPPQGIVRKRPADAVGVAAESNDAAKKSRFTELPV